MDTWRRESRDGIRPGILAGLAVALLLSLYVIALAIARGSMWFEQYHMWLWQIIASYIIGCLLAGAAAGGLAPILRWRLGAVVAGVLSLTILYGVAALAMGEPPSTSTFRFALLMGVAVGGPVGFITHYREVRNARAAPLVELARILLVVAASAGAFVLLTH